MSRLIRKEDVPAYREERRLKRELAAGIVTPADVRKMMIDLQEKMFKHPRGLVGDSPDCLKVCPLTHTFADGCYVRQIKMPKGMLIVSKIHKMKHPYFITEGDVSVLTTEGIVRLKAPYSGITPAGTKRILYIHEDTTWTTIHVTKETDLNKIEAEIIAKDFDELDKVIETTGGKHEALAQT